MVKSSVVQNHAWRALTLSATSACQHLAALAIEHRTMRPGRGKGADLAFDLFGRLLKSIRASALSIFLA
jgi:hypothetical protein